MNKPRKTVLVVRATMGKGGADRVTKVLLQNLDNSVYDLSLLLMRKEGPHLADLPAHVRIIDAGCSSLWFFLPAIISTINQLKPDVVFSTCGGSNIPLSIAAFFHPFRKWKAVVSERNVLFPPGKNVVKRSVMLLAKMFFYRFVDGLTAVSAGVREDMRRKLLINPANVRVVDNPMIDANLQKRSMEEVDHPWFLPTADIPVLVHAGRFVRQKDHDTLIRSLALARKTVPCRLFLLGDGPLMPRIKSLVKTLGLEEHVHFAGFDVNPFRFMSRCNAFVLSSIHEGLPGVLIQAMACGAPAISTNCPFGPDEIITQPGVNGLLVTVGDEKGLAAAIVSVIQDKDLAVRFRKEGPIAVKRFAVETAMKTYIDAIEA